VTCLLVALWLSSRLAIPASQQSSGDRHPVTGNSVRNTIDLRLVTYSQWEHELTSMRGRVVVVDLWATWCAPCVARFPAMITMSKRWAPKGVHFVTLSLDDKNEPGSFEHVVEFLRGHDARTPNFMMNEVLPDAFDKLNINAVPAVFIYDRSGNLRDRLTGDNPNHQFTEDDVEAALKTLVVRRGVE